MKRIWIVGVVGVLFLLAFISAYTNAGQDLEVQTGVAGEFVNEEEALKAREVLELNLNYAEEEDVEGYLTTVSSSAHTQTREAMTEFFNDYSVSHVLLEFEVMEQTDEELIAKARQQTRGTSENDDEEYRDHTAEVLHVFVKENGEWKINESGITDTMFLD